MKRIKASKSCRYADHGGPHVPQLEFIEGVEYDVHDEIAASVILNGDGHEVARSESPKQKIVVPESKDEGVNKNTESKPAKKSGSKN